MTFRLTPPLISLKRRKAREGLIIGCIFGLQVDGPITGRLISGSLMYFTLRGGSAQIVYLFQVT